MITILLALFCLQEPVQIPLPEGIRHSPTLSPDGKWVYYFESMKNKPENFRKWARNEALCRTSGDGVTIEKVIELGDTRGRLHWAPDGSQIYLTRRVADTNGDGEIGFGDGMSLTSLDPDGKNSKDLRSASPDSLTIYYTLPNGDLLLGLRDSYQGSTPKIIQFSPGKEDKEIAKGWTYYPIDSKMGMIRTLKVDQNADGKIGFRDMGSLSFINLESGDRKPFEPTHVLRGPIPYEGGLLFSQLQGKEGKTPSWNDNCSLIQSDERGNNPTPLTKPDSIWIPIKALSGSILLHRTRGSQTEIGLLNNAKEWKSLWVAPEGKQVGFPWVSPDQKTILFAVLEDGNKDGNLIPGEDRSNLLKLSLK